MGIAGDILKAKHIEIRELKGHLSTKLLNDLLVITDEGKPVSVNLPYSDVPALIDLLDELSDPETLESVREGREAIAAGAEGVPISNLFNKLRTKQV